MKGMFSGCSNLKKLTFGENFSTEKAEDVRYMFSGMRWFENIGIKHI